MKEYIEKVYKDSFESYFNLVKKDLKEQNKRFIITVNPETLMLSKTDTKIKEMLKSESTSLVPDGIAVIKAGATLGIKIQERITGVDLVEKLLEESNNKCYSIYLFGSKEDVISKMAKKIEEQYLNIKLLGYTNGYVENKDEVMTNISKLKPDIIIVALGIPHQEKLIYKHLSKFKKGIFIGVGGSLDVLSGSKKRAPKLFIKLNLEWLYRIIREPKRLKRFYNNNIKFLIEIRKERRK